MLLSIRNASLLRGLVLTTSLIFGSAIAGHSQDLPAGWWVPSQASTYVPVESWVYPAFERLAAEGYLPSAFFSLRPWTRNECARLVEGAKEIEEQKSPLPDDSDVPGLLQALRQEFAPELSDDGPPRYSGQVESVGQRVTVIAGRPLTDGYHFAETLVDDEGRPFGRGTNLYTGLSVRGNAGPFAGYLSAEFQRAASAPSPDAFAQQQIAAADFTPTAADGPVSGVARGRLLDGYVAYGFKNNQFTFGRQTLWWGPARSGSTLFSNNAEPVDMLRYDRVSPFLLPGPLRYLGQVRTQFFIGRLAGTQFTNTGNVFYGVPGSALSDQPFLHGFKVGFHPTPNFEFSVTRTVIFGGPGAPVTIHSFLRSIFSASTVNGEADPGDRRVAFDAQYRIPGLRSCLTGYFDGFSEDQPFPLVYPTESTWIAGAYLRCVPRLPKLTVRAEGLLSPRRNLYPPGFFYYNNHFPNGYTNERQLIGSWIGREGSGEQLWTTWHLSPKSSIEVSGRNMNVNHEFLSGGYVRDLRVAADIALSPTWQLTAEEQTEWWRFPLLSPTEQRNASVTLQLSYRPLPKTR
jgi:hypothetical protein